jgi:phosphoribosyl-ATP pyrophosphohydrolase
VSLVAEIMSSTDALARLAAVIESRKPSAGGNPETSYVARLLQKGPDAFLKKIGEKKMENTNKILEESYQNIK